MKRAMAIVADAFERVFSDDVRAAMEDAISRCRDAIGGVVGREVEHLSLARVAADGVVVAFGIGATTDELSGRIPS